MGNVMASTGAHPASKSAMGAVWLLVASTFVFSFTGLAAKLLPGEVGAPQLVVLRSAFMVTVVGLWAVARREPVFVLRGRAGKLLLLRGVLGTVGFILYFGALKRIPLADTVILFQAHPLVVAAVGPFLLGEAVGRRQWGLMLVSLAGVVLVVGPAAQGDWGGRFLALGCAVASGFAYSLVRLLRASLPALTIVLAFPLVAVVSLTPALALGLPGFRWHAPSPRDWLLILGVALSSSAGQVLLTIGLGRIQAARGTAINHLQVVFAVLWGILFLNEIPGRLTLAGAAVIVGSLLLLNLGGGRDRHGACRAPHGPL